MELGSKVTALEEEIAILKGEIKTILQEVRTAVLARENPFAADGHEMLQVPAAVPPAPLAAIEPEAPGPAGPQTPQQQYEAPSIVPFSGRDETDAARSVPGADPARRHWSAGSLATLVAWTQDTAARLDASDLDIVLSLARYGGLIDADLEATLTRLSATLVKPDAEPKQKGVTDYLLALRELAALIEEAESSYRAPGPMRRAS